MATGENDKIELEVTARDSGSQVIDAVEKRLEALQKVLGQTKEQAEAARQTMANFANESSNLQKQLDFISKATADWSSTNQVAQDIVTGMIAKIRDNGSAAIATAEQIQQLTDSLIAMGAIRPVDLIITPAASANLDKMVEQLGGAQTVINTLTGEFQRMGQLVDKTSTDAVSAYREQGDELKLQLQYLEATEAQLRKIDALVTKTEQGAGMANVPAPSVAVPTQNTKMATAAVADLDTQINTTIGALLRMGQLVDITSEEAVAGFRAQGNAMRENLITLGAQENELVRLETVMANVERQQGAYNVSLATGNVEYDKVGVGARRGANAVATLAFGLAAGGTSARTMAIGVGSAVSAMAAFSDSAAVAASASGIGALITVLAVVIGLFYDLNKEEKDAKDTLGELSGLTASQLKQLALVNEQNYANAVQHSEQLAKQVEDEAQANSIIKNIQADFTWWQAREAKKRVDNLTAERKKLTDALVAAEKEEQHRIYEETIKANNEIAKTQVERTKGPYAARRLAAQQEFDAQKRELDKQTADQQEHDRLLTLYTQQYNDKIAAINDEDNKRLIEQGKKMQLERLAAEEKSQQDVFQVQRSVELRRFELEKERIKNDKDLNEHPDRRKDQELLNEQIHTANLVKIEKDRSDAINEIVQESSQKQMTLLQQGPDPTKLRDDYKKKLKVLQDAIASTDTSPEVKAAAKTGIDIINALIPEEVAKARFDAIDKRLAATADTADESIKRIQALSTAHAITDMQARAGILASTIKERDAIAASIPDLQKQADLLPGNEEAQRNVEAYKTKLLELNLTIMQLSDSMFELKQAGIESSIGALQDLFRAVPALLAGQGSATAHVKDLQDHLGAAQEELNNLLANPVQDGSTAAAIANVRKEITDTNNELRNAKDALVTWKSLFLDAARSIAKALLDVSSHMLAVYLIQQLLSHAGFLIPGGGGGAAQLVGEVTGGGVPAATGGFILGPGTGTSDSIPAWLSNGEYVLNAQAVRAIGVDVLDQMNGTSLASRGRYRFAEGGRVDAPASGPQGGFDATVGLEDGLVTRHMRTRDGTQVIVDAIASKRKTIRSLLGG